MKPRVLYLMGYGRSGSTVLAMALGQHPKIVNVGEANALPSFLPGAASITDGRACGCLQPVAECPFWRAVAARAGSLGRPDHMNPPSGRGWRRYAPWLAPLSPHVEQWGEANAAFYRAVLDEADASLVVDGSKHASRAYWLWASGALDLTVVWLTRLPEDVLRSELRHGRSALKAALSWHVAQRRAAQLTRKIEAAGGEVLRLTYEEFTSTPRTVLHKLLGEFGLPWCDTVLHPRPHHVIGGNHEAKHDARKIIEAKQVQRPSSPLRLGPQLVWYLFNNPLFTPRARPDQQALRE